MDYIGPTITKRTISTSATVVPWPLIVVLIVVTTTTANRVGYWSQWRLRRTRCISIVITYWRSLKVT